MDKVFTISDPDYNCPKCGHNTIIGRSAQVCEDGCEMWVECQNCGYDPSDCGDHIETVWGWDKEFAVSAIAVWGEKMRALKAKNSAKGGE